MRRTLFLAALLALLLAAGSALAMSSTNYRLDWFVPLTGSGGAAHSANYAANFTVGQTAMGVLNSASYRGCLGYWCGVTPGRRVYLPLVLRG